MINCSSAPFIFLSAKGVLVFRALSHEFISYVNVLCRVIALAFAGRRISNLVAPRVISTEVQGWTS
jgi:hypothetical protein